jgi:hypothetical protein
MPHAPVSRVGLFLMPKGLTRYYGRGHLHFLTFSCYRRLPLLNTARARNLFVDALEKIRERHRFLVVGYVVVAPFELCALRPLSGSRHFGGIG